MRKLFLTNSKTLKTLLGLALLVAEAGIFNWSPVAAAFVDLSFIIGWWCRDIYGK